MKNNKKSKKAYVNIKKHYLRWTYTTDPWCYMAETLEIRRKCRLQEIVNGKHSYINHANYL